MLLLVTILLIIIFLMGLTYWEDTSSGCREFLSFLMIVALATTLLNIVFMLWNHTIEAY